MKKQHVGKKGRGEHTSIIDAAQPLVKLLEKVPDVGISPGKIDKKARSGNGQSVKFTLTDYGLLVQVTGALYVQTLTVRCGTRTRGQWVFEQIKDKLGRSYNRVTPPA